LDNVDNGAFDIGLVASFGHLIDPKTVSKFQHGLFNVHPSLLPRYRGSTPVQAAVFDRLDETGCTIIRIPPIEKFDIGDIISQKKLKIKPREYAIDLRDRLADLGASMSIDFLLNYEQFIRQSAPQSNEGKSLARKLKKDQGCLKFRTDTIDTIDRKVLAYTGFISLYIECLNGLTVRVEDYWDPKNVESLHIDALACDLLKTHYLPPGTIYFHKHKYLLCIKAQDGHWAAFACATPRGKPRMSALEFHNGYLSKLPPHLRRTDL